MKTPAITSILVSCILLQVQASPIRIARGVITNPEELLRISQTVDQLFARIDTRNTGILDEPSFQRMFAQFDFNDDGDVNEAEFEYRWVNVASIGDYKSAQAFFKVLDTDGDGVITKAVDIPRIMSFFDFPNKDKKVTQDEFKTQWAKMAALG